MYQKLNQAALAELPQLIAFRRHLHKNPETGWKENRTSSYIQHYLTSYGYRTITKTAVCAGGTGVIGILSCGDGPVTALRFDIDALPVTESESAEHFPFTEGFISSIPGCMHACGHDGHTAIGLGTARILASIREQLCGTVKLIFQPAEEGARGALPITEMGHLDDVDFLLGGHIVGREYTSAKSCNVICGVRGSLATTKLDAVFHGKAAHGANPQEGCNVNLALASAVLNLHGIPRHRDGATFINVGTIQGGRGRNIISDHGKLELETRGESTELNQYMESYARRILTASAALHNTICEISIAGSAPSILSDRTFMQRIYRTLSRANGCIRPSGNENTVFQASEDFSHMMQRVQAHGGNASYLLFPTDTCAPLHDPAFDFPESVMQIGVAVFCSIVYDLNHIPSGYTNQGE